jgi:beta-lactamase superfamily II metal-dependent hydrolase
MLISLLLWGAMLGGELARSSRGLDIYFIDVDGGAATLLITPEGKAILIDSGWPGRDDRDPKRITHVLKDVAKRERIDHLITTHWHMDHFGGVEGLGKLVPIDHFWDRGLPEDKLPGQTFPDGPAANDPLGIAYRQASQGKRTVLKAGDKLPLDSPLSAVVLAASGQVIETSASKNGEKNPACDFTPKDLPEDHSDNARSLAIRFELGIFGFLDCGDLTWNIEKMLVCPQDKIGQIDLFQVTHHGMDISNHPTLIKTIEPTVAVIDNGPRKGGAAETFKRLKAQTSIQAIYALHKNAATGLDVNADTAFTANRDPKGGEFIKVSVATDGASFTVQIGADGAPRRFESR